MVSENFKILENKSKGDRVCSPKTEEQLSPLMSSPPHSQAGDMCADIRIQLSAEKKPSKSGDGAQGTCVLNVSGANLKRTRAVMPTRGSRRTSSGNSRESCAY